MKILQNITEEHSENKENIQKTKKKGTEGGKKEKGIKILKTVPVPKSEV